VKLWLFGSEGSSFCSRIGFGAKCSFIGFGFAGNLKITAA
jgi:hypothetical protein